MNPQFKAWLPIVDNPNCWLIVDGVSKPTLIFYRPLTLARTRRTKRLLGRSIHYYYAEKAEAVEKHLPFDKAKFAYIGEYIDVANALGLVTSILTVSCTICTITEHKLTMS